MGLRDLNTTHIFFNNTVVFWIWLMTQLESWPERSVHRLVSSFIPSFCTNVGTITVLAMICPWIFTMTMENILWNLIIFVMLYDAYMMSC